MVTDFKLLQAIDSHWQIFPSLLRDPDSSKAISLELLLRERLLTWAHISTSLNMGVTLAPRPQVLHYQLTTCDGVQAGTYFARHSG